MSSNCTSCWVLAITQTSVICITCICTVTCTCTQEVSMTTRIKVTCSWYWFIVQNFTVWCSRCWCPMKWWFIVLINLKRKGASQRAIANSLFWLCGTPSMTTFCNTKGVIWITLHSRGLKMYMQWLGRTNLYLHTCAHQMGHNKIVYEYTTWI